MESTKAALESERKIQMLQMQAINALWKKVTALQPETSDGQSGGISMTNFMSGDNTEIVKELAQTCTVLQSQVIHILCSLVTATGVNVAFILDSATSRFHARYNKIYDNF